MKKSDIIDAYCRIRKIDQTIPDEVLDFMKESALERLDKLEEEEEKPPFPRYLNNKFAGLCVLTGKKCFNSHNKLSEMCIECKGYDFLIKQQDKKSS